MQQILKPLPLEPTRLDRAASRRTRHPASVLENSTAQHQLVRAMPQVLQLYLHQLPLLVIGSLAYLGCAVIFLTVPPVVIKDIFLPNAFAPVIALAGVGHYCTFGFLFLHQRRGYLASVFLSLLLFLQLQGLLTRQLGQQIFLACLLVESLAVMLVAALQRLAPTFKTLMARTSTSPSISDTKTTDPPQRRRGRQRKYHFFG